MHATADNSRGDRFRARHSPWSGVGEEEGFFHPERGFGQGSEEGPLGWTGFYDILLSMMEESELPGYKFDNEWGDEVHTFGQVFADDSAWMEERAVEIGDRCTIGNIFLEFMGVELSIPKCVYSNTTFDEYGRIQVNKSGRMRVDQDGDFTVSNDGELGGEEMKPLDDGESCRYLGVEVCADGSWKPMMDKIEEKIDIQTTALVKKSLSVEGAWIVSQLVLKPQVMYGALFTSGTDSRLEKIERKVRRMFFKHAKLPASMPLGLLGAHEYRTGLGGYPGSTK